MDDTQTSAVDPVISPDANVTQPEDQNKPADVEMWSKRFKQAEKQMRADFLWKYKIANKRVRAETEIKSKNSYKMTHNNVPLAYSIGSNFVNSVYFKSPNCNLTAREETDHIKVENTEIAVNDWLSDKKVKKTVKRCIWDAYKGGAGWRFIDYHYDDIPSTQQRPGIDPVTGQPTMQEVPIRIVTKNEIVLQRIRPDMIRFPKGFDIDNYQDSPWIGFDLIQPIEEVNDNPVWDEEIRVRITGSAYEKLSDKDYSDTVLDSTDKYAKISYAFIKPKDEMESLKLVVFSQDIKDKPLQEVDWDKGTVGYPIKPIYFNPADDDNSYPLGDCWCMESQFSAVDTWWKKFTRHVERSNPKRIVDASAIGKPELGQLKTNNDLEWVSLTNKDRRDIHTMIMDLPAPQTNPDVSILYQTARQLLDQIGPKSGLMQGAPDMTPGQEKKTATEARIIATGDMIDVEARIDDVHDFIVDIVYDVCGILEKSLVQPIPVKREANQTTNTPESISQVGKEGFTSRVNIDVDVESMQAQNKDVLRRQLLDSLKFLVNFEPIMNRTGLTLEPKFWLQRIMETMNIRNVEDGIVPLPPPVLAAPIPPGGMPPSGVPPQGTPTGSAGIMPPEAIEEGLAHRT